METEKAKVLKNHATTVRDQIMANSEVKKQNRLDYLEEGRKVRQKMEEERLKIEGIKERKLAQLGDLSIDAKYKAELQRKKIM